MLSVVPVAAAHAAPAFAAAAPAETPIMRLFRQHEALRAQMEDDATTSAEFDRLYVILDELEDRMAEETPTSIVDVAAKILALGTLREEVNSVYDPRLRADCQAVLAGSFVGKAT